MDDDDDVDDSDLDNEQVQALAAALAPQMQQLNELMDDPLLQSAESGGTEADDEEDLLRMDSEHSDTDPGPANGRPNKATNDKKPKEEEEESESSLDKDDDDDMDQEMEHLAVVEDILRQELDLAQNFAAFFGSPSKMALQREESGLDSNTMHDAVRVFQEVAEDQQIKRQLETTSRSELRSSAGGTTTPPTAAAAAPTGNGRQGDDSTSAAGKESSTITPQNPPRPTAGPSAKHSNNPTFATPPTTPQRLSSAFAPLYRSSSYTYTTVEHFRCLQLQQEPNGAWYSVDLTEHVLVPTSPFPFPGTANDSSADQQPTLTTGIKEYCLCVSEWKRLFVGLRLEHEEHRNMDTNPGAHAVRQLQPQFHQNTASTTPTRNNNSSSRPPSSTKRTSLLSPARDPQSKPSPPVRTISIRIRPDVLCGAVMDAVTQTFVHSQPYAAIKKRQGGHLQGTMQGKFRQETNPTNLLQSPFRTPNKTPTTNGDENSCTFFVDVQLCTQRSPHCERVLLLRIYHWTKEQQESDNNDEENLWLSPPPSPEVVAAQISDISTSIDGVNSEPSEQQSELPSVEEEVDQSANLHLKEACALIQRINTPELARKMRPISFYNSSSRDLQSPSSPHIQENAASVRAAVSESLIQNYRACPSVLHPGTTMTLPALSPQDWPVIQASWKWVQSVWDELETRELTYSSLLDTTQMLPPEQECDEAFLPPSSLGPRFGAFPALPTLDVQYCSQLRRLSRDAMTANLLKAASVLEEYARQAEYNCANLIDILRQTFVRYAVAPPPLPQPAPLSAYPLDFVPPQNICPPWGTRVMEAMNLVAAMTHDAGQSKRSVDVPATSNGVEQKSSPDAEMGSDGLAERAVQMVFQAFQKQDDEEHSARLARKNLQVMDRLAKMQAHQRASVEALSRAQTAAANAAADDFWAKAQKATRGFNVAVDAVECANHDDVEPWREVPLITWGLGVGGSSGTCYITANQIMFTQPKLIPLLGYTKSTWFLLRDVEFAVVPSEGTLLNPLATVQVLHHGTDIELYSFRPSHSAMRLKAFLDTVRKEAEDAEFAAVSDTLRTGTARGDAQKAILLEAESDFQAGL